MLVCETECCKASHSEGDCLNWPANALNLEQHHCLRTGKRSHFPGKKDTQYLCKTFPAPLASLLSVTGCFQLSVCFLLFPGCFTTVKVSSSRVQLNPKHMIRCKAEVSQATRACCVTFKCNSRSEKLLFLYKCDFVYLHNYSCNNVPRN